MSKVLLISCLFRSCAISALLLFAQSVFAAPNLQDVRQFPGLIIFSDHLKSDTFYYIRNVKHLATKEQRPDFQYHLNRYLGHKQLGNQNEFWVRGVLKFATTSDTSQSSYQELKESLSLETNRNVKLLAAPVTDSYNKVIYATIESNEGENFNGELDGGHVSSVSSGKESSNDGKKIFSSDAQRYTIGLTAHDAELFWQNFERDNLALSLSYGWSVKGVIKDASDEWVDSDYAIGNSLPITVSPKDYPELFKRNELWQRLQFAHRNLMVMCYDFINVENSDLYYVLVDVRFPTLRKQLYQESIKFTAGSGIYEKVIPFELANDIKEGYEYRVRRLSIDGQLTQSDWLKSSSAILDVSASESELANFVEPDNEENL